MNCNMNYYFTSMHDDEIENYNKDTYHIIHKKWIEKSKNDFNEEYHNKCYNFFKKNILGKRILDAGCGTGYDTMKFFRDGFEVFPIDLQYGFLKNIKEQIVNINCVVMDMKYPSFKNSTFDGIYCNSSFLHIPLKYSYDTLSIFYHLLKEGGVLFISHIYSLNNQDGYIVNNVLSTNRMLYCFCMSKQSIKDNLYKIGFKKIKFYNLYKKRNFFLKDKKLFTYQLLAYK